VGFSAFKTRSAAGKTIAQQSEIRGHGAALNISDDESAATLQQREDTLEFRVCVQESNTL